MRKPSVFRSPGWFGIRVRWPRWARGYWTFRDVRLHRHLFSERNRIGCARLAAVGPWELWRKR